MSIEQIREDIDLIIGKVLQEAIDNTDGTIKNITEYLYGLKETMFEDDDLVMVNIIDEALDTLNWQIKDIKPFN